MALKYCGGCNPGFDRVAYVDKIKSAAGPDIEWVTLEEEGFDAVLLVSGCETACPLTDCAISVSTSKLY